MCRLPETDHGKGGHRVRREMAPGMLQGRFASLNRLLMRPMIYDSHMCVVFVFVGFIDHVSVADRSLNEQYLVMAQLGMGKLLRASGWALLITLNVRTSAEPGDC